MTNKYTIPSLPRDAYKRIPGGVVRRLKRSRLDGGYDLRSDEDAPLEEANIITSLGPDGMHYPVIDLDVPCELRESSPGKFHLFIDAPVGEADYFNMLWAMVGAGLVETGFVSASASRGYTAARLPWIRKGETFALRSDGEAPKTHIDLEEVLL